MPSEIPQAVQHAIDEYIALVHEAVPNLLDGCYLHGSLALGAFNPGLSDLDFVAVTRQICSLSDIQALQTVHQSMAHRYPQMAFEGCYLQSQHVGLPDDALPSHPHFHDCVLQSNGNHDMNGIRLLTDYGVQWVVLGVLRQLYSLREHAVISKADAGLYALERVPTRWHRLI